MTRAIRLITLLAVAPLLACSFMGVGAAPATPVVTFLDIYQEIDKSGAFGIAIGDPAAPVTLVEYGDFTCPHCATLHPIIGQLIDEYVRDGRLRIVYKPITYVNPTYSEPAAQALICAAQQGKGWEMQAQIWDIYERNGPGAYSQSTLEAQARTLGLDENTFSACVSSPETAADIQSVLDEAAQIGIPGVPYLFVNGEEVQMSTADRMHAILVQEIEAALGQ